MVHRCTESWLARAGPRACLSIDTGLNSSWAGSQWTCSSWSDCILEGKQAGTVAGRVAGFSTAAGPTAGVLAAGDPAAHRLIASGTTRVAHGLRYRQLGFCAESNFSDLKSSSLLGLSCTGLEVWNQ